MAPPLFDLTLPALDRDVSVAAEGNVVVSGSAPEGIRKSGLRVRRAPARIEPPHADAGTCAVVLVARDAQTAVRRADALREWAHESVLPVIALVDGAEAVEDPMLWERALTCALRSEVGRLCRLLSALGLHRRGIPSDDDVEETWRLRQQLRELDAARGGIGLDAFVTGGMAFIGGSVPATSAISALTQRLELSPRTRLNTDAIRVTARPN